MPLILGIDHGDARIGLAISDDLAMFAHPPETVPARDTQAALERIAAIVGEKKIGRVVVGLPRNMDGTYGPAAERVRAFGDSLKRRLGSCEIDFVDERLTSVAAQKALHATGRKVKQ